MHLQKYYELSKIHWPDEQMAFYRAANELIQGEKLSLSPSPERILEIIAMATDLGLLHAHVNECAGGAGHGIGASLLVSQAFGQNPSCSVIYESIICRILDPLLYNQGNADIIKFKKILSGNKLPAMLLSMPGFLPALNRLNIASGEFLGIEEKFDDLPILMPSDENGSSLELLRILRGAFVLLGSADSLVSEMLQCIDPDIEDSRVRHFLKVLSTLKARFEVSRILSHNAGMKVNAKHRLSGGNPEKLFSFLPSIRPLIELSLLLSWFALFSAIRTALGGISGTGSGRDERRGSLPIRLDSELVDKKRRAAIFLFREDVENAVAIFEGSDEAEIQGGRCGFRVKIQKGAVIFGNNPEKTGYGGQSSKKIIRDLNYQEEALAAALYQTASLALSSMGQGKWNMEAEVMERLWMLIISALRIDLCSAAPENDLPDYQPEILPAYISLELDNEEFLKTDPDALPCRDDDAEGRGRWTKTLEKRGYKYRKAGEEIIKLCLDEGASALEANLKNLDRLWRLGPF